MTSDDVDEGESGGEILTHFNKKCKCAKIFFFFHVFPSFHPKSKQNFKNLSFSCSAPTMTPLCSSLCFLTPPVQVYSLVSAAGWVEAEVRRRRRRSEERQGEEA